MAPRMKVAAAVAVPERLTVGTVPAALLATESVALKVATEVGANVTEMMQFVPAASVVPQVLVCAKAEAPAPPSVMPVMLSTALPVFESCRVWAALVELELVAKVSEPGETAITGAGITAKFAVAVCTAFIAMVVVALVLLATAPVQFVN